MLILIWIKKIHLTALVDTRSKKKNSQKQKNIKNI